MKLTRLMLSAVMVAVFPIIALSSVHNVSIQGFDFIPVGIVINQGDSVRWTNNDAFLHTSTNDQGVWNSGDLATGQSFLWAFDSIGVFAYHCIHHPTMKDTISVIPANGFDTQVNIHDNFYDPAVIQINIGQSVRWVNMGIRSHTATSNTGVWNSDTLAHGEFYVFTFANEGVFHYHCLVHGLLMAGTIIVGKPDSVQFDIRTVDFSFTPADSTIRMGQNVRWINFGTMPHTSTEINAHLWDSGTLNPGDVFTLHADTAGDFHYICTFHPGLMTGTLHVLDTTTTGGCHYVIGDANGSGSANGLDVTYMVNYFKGGAAPPLTCDCPNHGIIYAGADANGSCTVNGLDVTYMVNFYRGGAPLQYCVDCPPAP